MSVRQGEFVALLGGNGTGKSTTLRLLSEGLRPYRGTVRHTGRLGVLPQNPQALFVKKTVREDLFETFDGPVSYTHLLRQSGVRQGLCLYTGHGVRCPGVLRRLPAGPGASLSRCAGGCDGEL